MGKAFLSRRQSACTSACPVRNTRMPPAERTKRHLTDLSLQAPAEKLGESGARTQGNRFRVGET